MQDDDREEWEKMWQDPLYRSPMIQRPGVPLAIWRGVLYAAAITIVIVSAAVALVVL